MKANFNKKYFVIPAIAAVGLLAGSTALASGGPAHMWKSDPVAAATQWEQKLTDEAKILGISADEMKNYWAAGKGVREIAKEKGISDADLQKKFEAARQAQHKEWLQSLVSQGKITQAQADARIKFMQDNAGKKMGHMRGGMMQGKGSMMKHGGSNQAPFSQSIK